MSNLLQEIANRKLTTELYDDGDDAPIEFLCDRNEILDLIIKQARDAKPAVVTFTADGNIQVDNPDNYPLSIRDYDTVEFLLNEQGLEEIADNYGNTLRQDADGDWYIERGNQE